MPRIVALNELEEIPASNDVFPFVDISQDETKQITFANLSSFTQSGTGAVQRTIQEKLGDLKSATDFDGVDPTGATDSYAGIQAAIDAIEATGGELFFPVGTYKISAGLVINSSNVRLRGEPGAVLDFSDVSGTLTAISVTGSGVADVEALAANVAEGAYTVDVAVGTGTTFAAGNYVMLIAEDTYDYNGTFAVKRGEIKKILSISTDEITFDTHVYEAYTTANTASLRLLSLIDNISIDGLEIIGNNVEADNTSAIIIEWTSNFRLTNTKITNFRTYGVATFNSVYTKISGNHFDGVRYTGAGTNFYAAILMNCTQFAIVQGNSGREIRHLVTTTCSATKYGQPYFCTIQGNILDNAMGGDAYASFAYENHGFGRWISWIGNIADSCYSGFNIEQGDQIISGNIMRGCRYGGIFFGDATAGRTLRNIVVTGNYIGLATSDNTAGFYGIRFLENADSVRENIIIQGNIIHVGGNATRDVSYGIIVEAGSGTAYGCQISGNSFKNPSAYSQYDYGIGIYQAGWVITGNVFLDFERVLYAAAAGVNFLNNSISLSGAAASTVYAVEVRGNDCVLIGNVFRNIYRAFYVHTEMTGTQIVGNAQVGSTTATVGDLGTGTVLAYAGGGF